MSHRILAFVVSAICGLIVLTAVTRNLGVVLGSSRGEVGLWLLRGAFEVNGRTYSGGDEGVRLENSPIDSHVGLFSGPIFQRTEGSWTLRIAGALGTAILLCLCAWLFRMSKRSELQRRIQEAEQDAT